ncbi:MAG: hypothetical protein AAGJ31_00465 [Verrucomicrobiota bacterium]
MTSLAYLASLLFVLSLAGQVWGDERPLDAWLPSPDGFRWPEPSHDAPSLETRRIKLMDLPEGLQDALEAILPTAPDLTPRPVGLVDLNEDGRPEWFVSIPEYRGSGEPFYEMFTSLDGIRYLRLGSVQGRQFLFHSGTQGWFEIEVVRRGDGAISTRFLKRFQVHEYRGVRYEVHHFADGRVDLTLPEPEELEFADAEMRPIREYTSVAPLLIDAFVSLPEDWFESGRPHWVRDHRVGEAPFLVLDPRERKIELLGDGAQKSVSLQILRWERGEDSLVIRANGRVLVRTKTGWRQAALEEK